MKQWKFIFAAFIFCGFSLSILAVGPIRVACIGDSITYGASITQPKYNSYPVQLGAMLGSGYVVSNFGVNGTTMIKSTGTPYWDCAQFVPAHDFLPDIIVIMLGTNDSKGPNWPPYHGEYTGDYLDFIQTFRDINSNVVVFICYPPPAYSTAFGINPSVVSNDIPPLIDYVAAQSGAIIIDQYTPLQDKPELFSDGIHPTKDGATVLAETAYRAIVQASGDTASFFTASAHSGWVPLTVTFTDISVGTITNRFWDFGDGFTTNTMETNVTHTYVSAGTNAVQLIISGPSDISTNAQTIVVAVPISPSAGFTVSPSAGSSPLPVVFTDTSTGTITNRYWDFGDGFTTNVTGTSISHTYNSIGTDTVQLIVSGPAGVSTNTQVAAVTVTAPVPPTAAFTAAPVSGTVPMLVTFTDTSTGSITNRYWDFGDGSTTNTAATGLTHTYTSAGTNTVTLIVSGPAGESTDVQTDLIKTELLDVMAENMIVNGSCTGTVGAVSLYLYPGTDPVSGGIDDGWWTSGGVFAISNGTLNRAAVTKYTEKGVGQIVTSTAVSNQTLTLSFDQSLIDDNGDSGYGVILFGYDHKDGHGTNWVKAGTLANSDYLSVSTVTHANNVGGGGNYDMYVLSDNPLGTTTSASASFNVTLSRTYEYFGVVFYGKITGSGDGWSVDNVSLTAQGGGSTGKQNQAISFANPGSRITTNTVVLSATATSGLPVSFGVVSGPASLNGSNITFTGAGSVTLSADQPGDSSWNAAPQTNVTFNVTKASATITLSNTNQTYDGSAKSVTVTTVPSGLTVDVTYNGSASAPSAVGTYAVTGTVNEAMYQGSATGTLTITATNMGDGNGNGIPDAWEIQYGITNSNPDALAANGHNTVREAYIAGLDPTNSSSQFDLSVQQAASQRLLQWNAVSGRVYSVYWTTNLTDGFQPLETNILWPQNSWTNSDTSGGAFYKLQVELY